MENSTKFLVLSVTVSLAAILLSFSLYVYEVGFGSAGNMLTRVSKVLTSTGEPEFCRYSGKYTDGKTVRGFIEEFGGDYFFRIRTKNNALSFCVYEKPVQHLMNDGSGKYYDYTKSDSLMYINSGSVYMTTIYRNEGGTPIGAMFEEKGSGSLTGVIALLYKADNLLAAKTKYLEEIKQNQNLVSSDSIDTAIVKMKEAVQKVDDSIVAFSSEETVPEANTTLLNQYNSKKEQIAKASKALGDAWDAYEKAFSESTGLESYGHQDITNNGRTNDETDLKYWVDKFNGSEAAGGDEDE